MKYIKVLFILMSLGFPFSSKTQVYGDKDVYLVDSLDVSEISNADHLLLNTYLKKIHNATSDTTKLRLISEIARETHNPQIGLKYNEFILKQINYINDTTYIKFKISSYSHIALIYSRIGEYKKAADNYNEAVKYLRYLNSDELQTIINDEKRKERKLVFIIASSIALFLSLFFGILYNRFKVIKKQQKVIEEQAKKVELQKEVVEKKNKDITDSIKYAQRIQQAILPTDKYMSQYYIDHFVFYQPRDIVSGDFYWTTYQDGYHYLAAIDCTGHGVPGSLMSMIGYQLLNKVVIDEKNTTPARILKALNREVKLFFEDATEEINDGMDIALVKFNHSNGMLEYSGANNPLIICRKSGELEQIKPTKAGIGGAKNKPKYENHEIKLELGDSFYIFTDGFQDQFGGDSGKKMKAYRLREILSEINLLPFDKRKQSIESFFEKWKGDFNQVDDVCVIGVGYFTSTQVFELNLTFKEKAELAQLIEKLINNDRIEFEKLLENSNADNEGFLNWKSEYKNADENQKVRLSKILMDG